MFSGIQETMTVKGAAGSQIFIYRPLCIEVITYVLYWPLLLCSAGFSPLLFNKEKSWHTGQIASVCFIRLKA